MALTIIWAPIALTNYQKTLHYLDENWTQNEIVRLDARLQKLLTRIAVNPKLFPVSLRVKNVYKARVDKNNYIVYQVDESQQILQIVNFRGTRQKPMHKETDTNN